MIPRQKAERVVRASPPPTSAQRPPAVATQQGGGGPTTFSLLGQPLTHFPLPLLSPGRGHTAIQQNLLCNGSNGEGGSSAMASPRGGGGRTAGGMAGNVGTGSSASLSPQALMEALQLLQQRIEALQALLPLISQARRHALLLLPSLFLLLFHKDMFLPPRSFQQCSNLGLPLGGSGQLPPLAAQQQAAAAASVASVISQLVMTAAEMLPQAAATLQQHHNQQQQQEQPQVLADLPYGHMLSSGSSVGASSNGFPGQHETAFMQAALPQQGHGGGDALRGEGQPLLPPPSSPSSSYDLLPGPLLPPLPPFPSTTSTSVPPHLASATATMTSTGGGTAGALMVHGGSSVLPLPRPQHVDECSGGGRSITGIQDGSAASRGPADGDKDDGEGGDSEDLPPGSYELVEMDAMEILAEHTHFCEICGKGFKRDANLRMHMRGHGDEYKTTAALARPERSPGTASGSGGGGNGGDGDRLPKIRRFSCPYASCKRNRRHRKFVPLKTMLCVKNHYRRTHCPKMLTCTKCKAKKFSVVADLKTHEKHCGSDKWQCNCGTTFSRKDKLLGHLALFKGHAPTMMLLDMDDGEEYIGGQQPSEGIATAPQDLHTAGFGLSLSDHLLPTLPQPNSSLLRPNG
eukprot:SM000021S06407  [mRNA]  locus=s21:46670:49494:- [translate_table: standard]